MNYTDLRNELRNYYFETSYKNAEAFLNKCAAALDKKYDEKMSAFEMKAMQYKTISELCDPVIFENSPFYYETGIVPGFSDGCRDYKGHKHAGGWTYFKNDHLFIDQDPELYALRRRQGNELLYLVCGKYNDTSQHFLVNFRPIFEKGLSGIYDEAKARLDGANGHETEFLTSAMEGLLAVKNIAEGFAKKAAELAEKYPENENYRLIAKSAAKCPWNKPETFYEALNTYAFMRKVIGSLEGIGPNSFGRIDVDLYPIYEAEIKAGRITKEDAYELIAKFLLLWDCHYDHDMQMVGYSDHELENTYTLGGCYADGTPVYNEITELFLKATQNEGIIFPKIKVRFSKNSPKEYLDIVNAPVIKGTSTILYVNDDTLIPAFTEVGRTVEEARDYLVSGCWGTFTNCNDCRDDASYMNLLKVFEFMIHNRTDKMEETNMHFDPIDGAESFEDVYRITLQSFETFIKERTRVITKGAQIWHTVDPLPFYSSMMVGCLDSRKDFTEQGTKYKDDNYMFVGFPNVIDSLLAIKTLCFDEKRFTLADFLKAVRSNWENAEYMRLAAISCHGWGDGSEATAELASRLHTDIYNILSGIEGTHGGRIHMGHMTYTEIRFWGEKTLATPDGRHSGEYFAQGLTPSRLKKISSVTSVAKSFAAIDKRQLAGNNVVNIILPDNLTLDGCELFLRNFADTALGALQLNCVSRETLLDAQKHPEKYPELIVRVCGFSAKFTSLSPEWQDEVLSRNFYK